MALTPQQLQSLTLQAKARGYDEAKTAQFLDFADKKLGETTKTAIVPHQEPVQVEKKPSGLPSFLKKVGSVLISNEKGVGESLAAGIIPHLGEFKDAEKAQAQDDAMLAKLAQAIRDKKARGEDASKLMDAYKRLTNSPVGFNYEELNPAASKTNKQALAEVAGVGLDVLTAGTYGKAATTGMKTGQLAPKALPTIIKGAANVGQKTIGQGIVQGAKAGAKAAILPGAGYGAIGAAKENGSIGDIALGALKGAGTGAVVGGVLGGATGGISTWLEQRAKLKETAAAIAAQQADEPAKVAQKGVPTATNPQYVKDAVKKGIDEKQVKIIVEAAPEDRAVFQRMFKNAQEGSKDLVFASKNRPIDEAGNTFLSRVPVLQKARQDVGKKLGELVKSFPANPTAIDDVYNNFTDDLADAGIKLGKKGKLSFSGSAYANDGNAQKILQGIYDDIAPVKGQAKLLSPQTINTIRQRIYNDIDLSSKGATAMSGNAERIAGKARDQLGKILENYNPKYAELSTEYATLSDVLSRTNKLLGKDFRLGNATASRRGGEVMRRMLSNASANPTEVIQTVDRLAKNYNKGVKGDLTRQVIFADLLEDLFGLTPQTSLAGQMNRALESNVQAGVGIAEDVANTNVTNLLSKGIMFGIRKVKGITPEKQQEAIARLIGLSSDDIATKAGSGAVKEFIKGFTDTSGGLTTKSVVAPKTIDKLTRQEVIDAIDYIRLGKGYNQKQEELIGKLVKKFGITAKTNGAIANQLEQIITKAKAVNLPKAGEAFAVFTKSSGAKDYSVPLSASEYADDVAALLKSTKSALPKKAMSLADEAAELATKKGVPTRLFDTQQTKFEGLINNGSYEEALKLAQSLVANSPKEQAMKKSLIVMAANYLKDELTKNGLNIPKELGKLLGAGALAGAAYKGSKRSE